MDATDIPTGEAAPATVDGAARVASADELFDLAEVLERISDGVIACDAELRVRYLNAAAERWLAAPREQLLGRDLTAAFPDLGDRVAAALRRVIEERAPVAYEHQHAPSGRCFRHTLYPARDGGVAVYFRDITGRKQAAARLDSSEQRYRTLFQSIDQGFCVIEMLFDDATGDPLDYRFLEVNPSFERQTGLQDVVGRTARELAPGLEDAWFRIYGRVARTGEPVRFEHRADALQRWFDVYAFRTGEPHQHRVALLFSDVTERHQTETALQEADRRKDEFLAKLAHELRNPLAPLRSGLEIMQLAADDRAVVEQSRLVMTRQIEHLVALVDDLLDVSRIRRGLVTIERKRIDLMRALDGAIEAARPALRQRGHELTIDLPTDEVRVDADVHRLTQALANLLLNAAKYTDPGGRICVTVRQGDGQVSICVSDNGIGIPPAMLDRVFEPFVQVDGAGPRAQGGLGIGLTIVRQLVRLHDGEVEALSEGEGRGSRFIVRLPLAGAAEAAATDAAAATVRYRPRRVLVADDNRDAAEAIAVMLGLLGHDVRTAFDGEQAVAEGERLKPELVLLDLGMPGLDGFAVARRLRVHDWAAGTVLVAVTGWGQESDRAATRAAGFDHHLVKPIELSALDSIFAALDQRG